MQPAKFVNPLRFSVTAFFPQGIYFCTADRGVLDTFTAPVIDEVDTANDSLNSNGMEAAGDIFQDSPDTLKNVAVPKYGWIRKFVDRAFPQATDNIETTAFPCGSS